MTVENGSRIVIGHLVAAADLRTSQYRFVTLDSSGGVILAATAGMWALGVLQNQPNTGEPCEIVALGHTKLMAGATVDEGQQMVVEVTTGQAVNTGATTDFVIARCLEAAADGVLFEALVTQEGQRQTT